MPPWEEAAVARSKGSGEGFVGFDTDHFVNVFCWTKTQDSSFEKGAMVIGRREKAMRGVKATKY
jgi:hypothetical protein